MRVSADELMGSWYDKALARCAAATSGPWEWDGDELVWARFPDRRIVADTSEDNGTNNENAAFIAAARTDLPRALALIEEMAAILRGAVVLRRGPGQVDALRAALAKQDDALRAALAKLEEP